MHWLLSALGIRQVEIDKERDRERVIHRLMDQEQRVQALDRTVEVIQRELSEDRPYASE